MLTKVFYTAFYLHRTNAMGWLLYLDATWGIEGKKGTSGCMDSKENK